MQKMLLYKKKNQSIIELKVDQFNNSNLIYGDKKII